MANQGTNSLHSIIWMIHYFTVSARNMYLADIPKDNNAEERNLSCSR